MRAHFIRSSSYINVGSFKGRRTVLAIAAWCQGLVHLSDQRQWYAQLGWTYWVAWLLSLTRNQIFGHAACGILEELHVLSLIPVTKSHQAEVKDELVTTLAWDAHKYMVYIYVYRRMGVYIECFYLLMIPRKNWGIWGVFRHKSSWQCHSFGRGRKDFGSHLLLRLRVDFWRGWAAEDIVTAAKKTTGWWAGDMEASREVLLWRRGM